MEHSRTTYVVLGILAFHDHQSGYHIRKTIETTVGYFWSESYGQLYPTLKRLLTQGLIKARETGSGRSSMEYSITAKGRTLLSNWLAEPYRDDPPRNEFLLKLFFANNAPAAVPIRHLRQFHERQKQALANMEQIDAIARKQNNNLPGFPYWMLTLSFGIAMTSAAVKWSETAIAALPAETDHAASAPQLHRKPAK